MSELEVWVQSQEKEIKNHLNKLQEVQSLLEKSKAELAMKEQALSKSRDNLTKATVQQEQTRNKCSLLEQKLKQVSEDLNCQRQNAESVRRLMEQKSKEKEKEYQQDLSDQQRAYRNLEHQCKQEKNQLNQEIQKLKSEHLALQSAVDKMATRKQLVDRELEEVKANFHCAEKELESRQRKGDTLQKSLQEALKEKDNFSTWQTQSTQRTTHLEAKLKRLEKELTLNQRSREEMKAENLILATKLKDLQQDHEFQPNSGNADLAALVCELTKKDRNEIDKCEPDEDSHQSNNVQSVGMATVVGWPVKVREEEMLDSVEGSQLGELMVTSVLSDQDSEANLEEDSSFTTKVKLEVVPSGALTETRGSEEARDVFSDPEEKTGAQPHGFEKETEEAGGAEAAVAPGDHTEKGEAMIDWLDKPITASWHFGGREVELDEVKTKNQMLQQELDELKQTLDSKVIEDQRNQQTVAELRRKLKQVMQRNAAEAESPTALVTLQAGQISALEKDLEHERTKVAKMQESNKILELECSKVSELARTRDAGSDGDEIQILQSAASKKMQQLEQQIVELNCEKSCIEEIIKANGRLDVVAAADERGDLLLECLEHEDVRNLEFDAMPSNHLCCDPGEMLGRKLEEEKTRFVEIMKGGDGGGQGKGNRELLFEYFKHKVVEQLEFDERLLEHQKLLGELQKMCDELAAGKEQEEQAKRQAQERFDHLQARIHRETQQLTVALEVQSKNIEGLLLSMEEKDHTIQVLNERLQDASTVLIRLQKENCELKANCETVWETSTQKCVDNAGLPEDIVLGQPSGAPSPQAKRHENGGLLSMGGRALTIEGRPADGTVQNSETGYDENVCDNSLLLPIEQAIRLILTQEDQFKEPEERGSAVRKMPELNEDPAKQEQQTTKIEASRCEASPIGPKEQRASSVPSTSAPSGKSGITSAVICARQNIQLTQNAESLRPRKEQNDVAGNDADQRQSIRCPGGLQMKIGELQEESVSLHTKTSPGEAETPTEKGTTETADSKFALVLGEKQSVGELRTEAELIEEVERVTGRFNEALKVSEEERQKTEESNQKVVGALNEELNSLHKRCTILEQERECLCAEVRKAQEAAGEMQYEKEGLMEAIQSSEALLRGSTEEKNHLERELEALREWRQKGLGDGPPRQAGEESGQEERQALRGTQDQMLELEDKCRALNSEVASAKLTQEQIQEELEKAQTEKSELQCQVDRLQKVAAELDREKMELQAKLKQSERSPVGKEEILHENGLPEDHLPIGSQQLAPAQITARKLGADLEALRQTLQEKSEEVDRNLFNFSDLENKRQELQAANKILFKAVNHLHQCKAKTLNGDPLNAVGSDPQTPTEDGKPVARQTIGREPAQAGERDQTKTNLRSKGRSDLAGRLPRLNPAELMMKISAADLATRIQRNRQFRHHLSVAFDETEYEPYGLPDVVQKGFADIPSGPPCPHILRRATLNSTLCPQQQGEGKSV
ncbi:centromere protein F-like [Scyliorhinus canicula]|uniref:centromere protein F-like n=1 Tax=Scyliorhinus canicula TaxID=7830 RepID=UPI0018F7AD9C|nr:centromere protein F-like [Scyliorhinus canicula]